MKLKEVLDMIFGTGIYHVVRVMDAEHTEYVYHTDYEAGDYGEWFTGKRGVKSISEEDVLITVRLW